MKHDCYAGWGRGPSATGPAVRAQYALNAPEAVGRLDEIGRRRPGQASGVTGSRPRSAKTCLAAKVAFRARGKPQ